MEKDQEKVQGTAAVLHETKVYEDLVAEFGAPVADGLMAKAINNALPNANIVSSDVAGFSKVNKALRTGKVDLWGTADVAQQKAQQATQQLIEGLQNHAKEGATIDEE